ncbi:MAG: zinc ABC transporter substrate-binding protein [Oleiphilaceae bacterium]|nr:zinc ABC transporter substrate-binding protein [Oleiphilaceae bacterium]
MTRHHAVLILSLCLGALLPLNAQAQSPSVMTSLHPIALLTAEIAGDDIAVESLVPPSGSPHTYSLRPSKRRKLQQAELFIWVGPGMEVFLARVMRQPDLAEKSVELSRVLEGPMAAHDDHHGHDGHDGHDDHDRGHSSVEQSHSTHAGAGTDPHMWLDPALALAMAQRIAEALKTLEGVDKTGVDARLADFEQRLERHLQQLDKQLEPARDMAIFTYHDAFRRFAEHFDLRLAGYLTITPDQNPGARALSQLRQRLQQEESPCVMTEPQFSRDWWQGISNGLPLGLSVWDPMGSDIPVAHGGYLAFLQQLAERVLECRSV